nr:MAG TPA: hypothetical protein [Caudoviricetes sp.]
MSETDTWYLLLSFNGKDIKHSPTVLAASADGTV